MSLDQVRVDEVIVGERARRDYGDLTSLMDSIREHGILQPIGLAPGNNLLFGGRRLEAAKRLGMTVIDVTRPRTQTDALSLLKAERDENTCRKDMTLSELVDVGRRIEELERPRAAERRASGLRAGDAPAPAESRSARTIGTGNEKSLGETRRIVGEALGLSGATYERAKTVVTAAEDETAPEEVRAVAQEAVKEMDETGKAWKPYQKVKAVTSPKPRPEPQRPPAPPKYGGNRRKHLQVIQSMTTALDGLAIAADEITELDSSVTQEEAAQLVGDLSRQIRSLNQIRNLLKERTK